MSAECLSDHTYQGNNKSHKKIVFVNFNAKNSTKTKRNLNWLDMNKESEELKRTKMSKTGGRCVYL